MDSALSRQFLRLKRSGVKPHTWLNNHLELVGLLVPAADLRKVVEAHGEWKAVAGSIKNLMDSSQIGRTVFSFCSQLVSASTYKVEIEKFLAELKEQGITEQTVATFKSKAQKAAEEFKAISSNPPLTLSK